MDVRKTYNLRIDSMVLIKKDFLPSTKWLLDKSIEIFSGSDNKVLAVKIRIQNREFKRAVIKIAVLPIES